METDIKRGRMFELSLMSSHSSSERHQKDSVNKYLSRNRAELDVQSFKFRETSERLIVLTVLTNTSPET
jgi:hypothetical protein